MTRHPDLAGGIGLSLATRSIHLHPCGVLDEPARPHSHQAMGAAR
jgi:hypothetical protein